MENDNPSILIRVAREHDVDDVVPSIESAGVIECVAFRNINLVMGRVAVASEQAQVLKDVLQLPEIVTAQILPDIPDDEQWAIGE